MTHACCGARQSTISPVIRGLLPKTNCGSRFKSKIIFAVEVNGFPWSNDADLSDWSGPGAAPTINTLAVSNTMLLQIPFITGT